MKETSNSQTWDLVQLINNYSNNLWINFYESQVYLFNQKLVSSMQYIF